MSEGNGKGSIMVVDDERSLRDVISRALRKKGFDVVTAASGLEALDKASLVDFDLMFLDIRMPGMSGLEVLARMAEEHPTTIVVMLTAVSGFNARYEAAQHEAFAYLPKPCDLAEVTEMAERLLSGHKEEQHTVAASV